MKVRYGKANDHKYVTIPKHCNIETGQYVRVSVVKWDHLELVGSVQDPALALYVKNVTE